MQAFSLIVKLWIASVVGFSYVTAKHTQRASPMWTIEALRADPSGERNFTIGDRGTGKLLRGTMSITWHHGTVSKTRWPEPKGADRCFRGHLIDEYGRVYKSILDQFRDREPNAATESDVDMSEEDTPFFGSPTLQNPSGSRAPEVTPEPSSPSTASRAGSSTDQCMVGQMPGSSTDTPRRPQQTILSSFYPILAPQGIHTLQGNDAQSGPGKRAAKGHGKENSRRSGNKPRRSDGKKQHQTLWQKDHGKKEFGLSRMPETFFGNTGKGVGFSPPPDSPIYIPDSPDSPISTFSEPAKPDKPTLPFEEPLTSQCCPIQKAIMRQSQCPIQEAIMRQHASKTSQSSMTPLDGNSDPARFGPIIAGKRKREMEQVYDTKVDKSTHLQRQTHNHDSQFPSFGPGSLHDQIYTAILEGRVDPYTGVPYPTGALPTMPFHFSHTMPQQHQPTATPTEPHKGSWLQTLGSIFKRRRTAEQ